MEYGRFILIVIGVLALLGCKQSDPTTSVCASTDVLASAIDLSIEGRGFFTFKVDNETLYGRKGDFCVDKTGYLTNSAGHYVLGFEPIGSGSEFNTGSLARIVLTPSNDAGGLLSDVHVNAAGVVEGVYTLGGNVVAGQLAIAAFSASQNLQAVNDVMCREILASGGPSLGEPGTGFYGTIQAGLEGVYTCEQGRFDLQVSGQGYFVLNNAGTMHYDTGITFGTDKDGYYVDDHGYRVMGYAVDTNGNIIPDMADLRAATSDGAPAATSTIELDANLNAGSDQPINGTFDKDQADSYNEVVNVTVYDSLGSTHTAAFYFVKTAVVDIWHLYSHFDETPMQVGGADFQTVAFTSGQLSSAETLGYDLFPIGTGALAQAITLNLTRLTQLSSDFIVNSTVQDGYTVGVVTATHIASNGETHLDFSNGRSGVLHAQLLLANFADPGELELSSDTETFLESSTSGAAILDIPVASGSVILATAR